MAMKNGRSTKWAGPTFGLAAAALLALSPLSISAQIDFSASAYWRGWEVFQEKGCIRCHSIRGTNGKGGPDLGERSFYGTYLELAARMWNHFPKMYERMQESGARFPEINQAEMGELVTFLSFIRYAGKPGTEHKGQRLLEQSCMKCHRFGERGRDVGPNFAEHNDYLSSTQLVAAMWNHGPDMMAVFGEQDVERPVFKGDDVDDILSAIRSYMPTRTIPARTYDMGDPSAGKVLCKEKGCVKCHSIRGVGGVLGPDFATLDLDCSAAQIAGRMWNHGPKMWDIMKRENTAFPRFEEGEMANIVAYLYTLKLEDKPGDPERGRRLLLDKGCLNCHALNGRGGTVSVDLATLEGLDSPLAMIAAMWNHAPGMREKQVERDLKWAKLTAQEMADLHACLQRITRMSNAEH